MTDKELLELAAKAANLGVFWGHPASDCYDHNKLYLKQNKVMYTAREWNPLENDGDALRLACDLALQVFPVARTSSGAACSAAASVTGERLAEFADASVGVREATRRAIVRAAAEIGGGGE